MEYVDHDRITLTIEGQLENYTYCKNTTNRHKLLWNAWNHNKEWMSQLLEWVMLSYQNYSKHDVSHAVAVIHNIEMLLGENGVKQLSASDCFLILHVVYIHDIGMCITNDYRENLMHDADFINFLNQKKNDRNLAEYADILLTQCEKLFENESSYGFGEFKQKNVGNTEHETWNENRIMFCLERKLKVYYAIIFMVAEYRRGSHGLESQNMLTEWIKQPEKLGAGFSTSGIPIRFFYTIGACASAHTSYDFQTILNLPTTDGGYAHDFMHPRFAAVLLQLGDALDLDNDRFHPLVKEFVGKMPANSEAHYGKHKSIRRLLISTKKIRMEADCETPVELRLVQQEYEGIRDILQNATYHWSAIRPSDMDIVLPELEDISLRLQGKLISESLVNMRFDIQQDKAFSLLQGDNIYKRERYTFLREIFQNAIDASKRQFWMDWKGSCWYNEKETHCEKYLSPNAYPIEVEFHLAVKAKYSNEYVMLDVAQESGRLETFLDSVEEKELGVVVRVRDYGPGISSKDIEAIADVGSSYERYGKECREMPRWLQPTAQFGVGLQSVFLVADTFIAETHERGGAAYKIEFCTASVRKGGEINVTPLIDKQNSTTNTKYGTTFEVFIANSKKREHLEDVQSWSGLDPFGLENSDKYEEQLNRSRELMVQLLFYLDDIVGEKIFPINIKLFEINSGDFTKNILEKKKDMQLDLSIVSCENHQKKVYSFVKNHWKMENNSVGFNQYPFLKKNAWDSSITWTYSVWKQQASDSNNQISGKQTYSNKCKCRGMVDLNLGKLFVASVDNEVYACFSAERILKMRKEVHDPENAPKYKNTKIYYKGIYVTEMDFEEDMNLLEYIDIKGALRREHLAINRSEFTSSGEQYIREEIYPRVLSYAYMIICKLGESDFIKKISQSEDEINSTDDRNKIIKDLVLDGVYEKEGSDGLFMISQADTDVTDIVDIVIKHNRKTDRKIKDTSCDESIHRRILFLTALPSFWRTCNCVSYILPAIPNKNSYSNEVWDRLLGLLGKFIRKQINSNQNNKGHWSKSSFYNMRCALSGNTNNSDPWPKENLPEIMSTRNHYVVISVRSAANSLWDEYLVKLDEEDEPDKIKNAIMKLRTESNPAEKKKLEEQIEEWPRPFFSKMRDLMDRNSLDTISLDKRLNQYSIIMWMLGNLPSLAVFSDKDNNMRMNLLGTEHMDSIYLDRYIRKSIYERMVEFSKKKKIQRFSTVTNTGYCQLGLRERHPSAYFLKRGRFGKVGQRHMIVPLDGPSMVFLAEHSIDSRIVWTLDLLEEVVKCCYQIAIIWRKNDTGSSESKEWMQPILDNYGSLESTNDKGVVRLTGDIERSIVKRMDSGDNGDCSFENGLPEIDLELAKKVCINLLTKNHDDEMDGWIKKYMIPGYILLRDSETNKSALSKNQRSDSELEKKKMLVKKYFAYYEMNENFIEPYHVSIRDEGELQKKLLGKKNALVSYVAENSWVRNLSESDVVCLYEEYIDDMFDCMLEKVDSKIEEMHKYFLFSCEAN